ncbi:MAG: hypothetical protein LBR70_00890 [Lactobacillaceae bacterium]|jgi:hypothetical protein|nr:hypothetical protein [Lactobacillaceae bacterium]
MEKEKKSKEGFPQYGGVGIFAFVLLVIGIFTFSLWHFLAALVLGGVFFGIIYYVEEESYEGVNVLNNNPIRILLSCMLFLVLWVIFQALGGFFWCFLIGACICVFFHICRLPLCIALFDFNHNEDKDFKKWKVFNEAIKDEDSFDLFLGYNLLYIGICILFFIIGLIASPGKPKDESRVKSKTETVSSSSSSENRNRSREESEEAKVFRATTLKVVNQVEDNNTVYYIVVRKDTLRCSPGTGAIWLKPEGGDDIKYSFEERKGRRQVTYLEIVQ